MTKPPKLGVHHNISSVCVCVCVLVSLMLEQLTVASTGDRHTDRQWGDYLVCGTCVHGHHSFSARQWSAGLKLCELFTLSMCGAQTPRPYKWVSWSKMFRYNPSVQQRVAYVNVMVGDVKSRSPVLLQTSISLRILHPMTAVFLVPPAQFEQQKSKVMVF